MVLSPVPTRSTATRATARRRTLPRFTINLPFAIGPLHEPHGGSVLDRELGVRSQGRGPGYGGLVFPPGTGPSCGSGRCVWAVGGGVDGCTVGGGGVTGADGAVAWVGGGVTSTAGRVDGCTRWSRGAGFTGTRYVPVTRAAPGAVAAHR